jgi:dephospho-CoA kinase
MLVVGLTGGIGAGKSTVSAMLAARGAIIIDADLIAREVVEPGGRAYDPVIDRFGKDIVAADGTIDRPALAEIVFGDEQALKDLNGLTHPAVGAVMAERLAAEAETDHVVILDIPLLAEGGRKRSGMAGVLVVDVPEEIALARLVGSRGMTDEDARARIAAQASREQRRAIADVVIDNSGSMDDLAAEVDRAWAWIESRRRESDTARQ